MCGKFHTPLRMVRVRVIFSWKNVISSSICVYQNLQHALPGWHHKCLLKNVGVSHLGPVFWWRDGGTPKLILNSKNDCFKAIWQRHPRKNFSPFYFTSPDIIEVKICYIQTDGQTDKFFNTIYGGSVDFFFNLNLLHSNSLCLQGDKNG